MDEDYLIYFIEVYFEIIKVFIYIKGSTELKDIKIYQFPYKITLSQSILTKNIIIDDSLEKNPIV